MIVNVVMLGDCIAIFRAFSFEGLVSTRGVGGEVAEEYFPCLRSMLCL